GVILCYRKEPGKEINDNHDNRGQFSQILDSFSHPSASCPFCVGDAPNLTHLATRRNAGNRKRLEQLQLLLSRVKRFERSEAVERLERLEPAAASRSRAVERLERLQRDPFLAGITKSARAKTGNKKNSHRKSVPLDTCLLMVRPGALSAPLSPFMRYAASANFFCSRFPINAWASALVNPTSGGRTAVQAGSLRK